MAKPFEKGNQIGKLGGRPAIPQEIRELHETTKAMVLETMSEYMGYRTQRLLDIIKDPDAPVYRKMVARVILRGVSEGDVRFLDYICERFLGPAQQRAPKLIDLTDEDVINGLRAIKANTD